MVPPVRDQVTFLDIQLASDSNEQTILGHHILNMETLSGISSIYEISREALENIVRNHKNFVPKALVVLMQAHSSPHRMPAG